MKQCPFKNVECTREACVLWIELEDFQGCAFDVADQAIRDFAENTLKPAARLLDELVKKYKASIRR